MTTPDHQSKTIVLPDGAWREIAGGPEAPLKPELVRRWGAALCLCAAAFAVYGSLVPFNFEWGNAAEAWRWIREAPHTRGLAAGRVDFFSNLCLFVPIGFGGMAWL
ncbi:MAG: hypothetical protein KF861_14185, partial [Planctomycetaceae bacterium]|nr:hypothetical protein [Planctomycetaceae bacterium]